MISKLALGTVQFGSDYGIKGGKQVLSKEVKYILEYAQKNGMNTLDTAINYGDSEIVLGAVGLDTWNVVTKLPAIPVGSLDVESWIVKSVKDSLTRLRIHQLYGLLLHRPADLNGIRGKEIYKALNKCVELGLVNKLGVSIYESEELGNLPEWFSPKLVQAPFNVLDQRIYKSGWLKKLAEEKIEVHVRSLFLQGLLLLTPEKRPLKFQRWNSLWQAWEIWLKAERLSAVQACLQFALQFPNIDRFVVGVDSLKQLQQIMNISKSPNCKIYPVEMVCEDPDLLNPFRWKFL